MLPQFTLALVPILAFLPSVAAHGVVTSVVIDGTTYYGNMPSDDDGGITIASPIRQVADTSPVKGADNPDINCGLSAQFASMVVPANPGSSMEFYWGGPGNESVSRVFHLSRVALLTHLPPLTPQWPHNTGPLMTYMAACDTATCDKYNSTNAKWFKIDQIGKEPDGVTFYQQDVSM